MYYASKLGKFKVGSCNKIMSKNVEKEAIFRVSSVDAHLFVRFDVRMKMNFLVILHATV